MISLKSNNRFTLINVVNYCNYQGSDFENEQQMNNQRTTNEQQMNTVKNIRTKEIKNKELKHIDDYFPVSKNFRALLSSASLLLFFIADTERLNSLATCDQGSLLK
jgi:hypothetical protein